MSSLLIIGASARAAAMSATRAGITPRAIDQFGDVDLSQLGTTSLLKRYPAEALTLIRNEPDLPWIYTGGLENHPRLLDRLAASRTLLGNTGSIVRRARDGLTWRRPLEQAGIAVLPESADPTGIPTDGSWLAKRRRSAGGLHVRRWTQATAAHGLPRGWYLQRFVEGVQLGTTFVAHREEAVFLGATRSLLTTDVPSLPWLYGGSVGPVPLAEPIQQQLTQLGNLLARELSLSGLFGVDLILADDQLYALELNPRYTASVECLELATGLNSLSLHIAACRGESLPNDVPRGTTLVGKQIVYARRAVQIEPRHVREWLAANLDPLRPLIADIPQVGTTIAPGEPIATVFASGNTIDETRLALEQRADHFLSTCE
ncbi:MAG: ATP-grasp domain-containing protein [Planctomycetaceae bacterium]|nr:ATP-grasp domain-containing protein [Planctomycetaceae bacterium]